MDIADFFVAVTVGAFVGWFAYDVVEAAKEWRGRRRG